MNTFEELLRLRPDTPVIGERIAVCPDLGGRVFAEIGGVCVHRLDLENVADPTREFNNFGGGSLWPAPEGGDFGFNYPAGADWCVQPGINSEPYRMSHADGSCVEIAKSITLTNRIGKPVEMEMRRRVETSPLPSVLAGQELVSSLCYTTRDSINILSSHARDEALIAAWTLEQFDAREGRFSFVVTDSPESAVNYDFYEHPEGRIRLYPKGLSYHTDGKRRGQIGIKAVSKAKEIGFLDTELAMVCLRFNGTEPGGVYFNIADNEQAHGPWSAADNFSIFNSDPDGAFFELETIGPMLERNGGIAGSQLVSTTAFAVFESREHAESFVFDMLH